MKFRPFAAAALLFALVAAPSAAQQTERQWIAAGPIPERYEIALTPDIEGATFAGEATITVTNAEAAPVVIMNALNLNVTRATIDNSTVTATTDNDAQTLTLTPRRPLAPGRHVIRIRYSGEIIEDPYGLFRVDYEADGETRHVITTQFEPADARRLAPMWDQPNRRAVFQLTITHPANLMAVSNMPVAREQRVSGNRTRTTFQDTPAMASYLLFLAVGDFERVTTDVNGVELGIVTRRGDIDRARYAMQAGVEALTYYTEYFGIRYPLPKLDMIAVPGAGGFAAMENWGAILYFDQYLLLDDDRSNEADRQFVWSAVAHEIAHQWFGNLVTMNWWDDLWLNEGFASWMAAKAVEHVHPDWQPWLAQMTQGTSAAMSLDARVGTHPIVQTVNTIDEANLAFDDITYDKGLAVIRMLEAYVGEEGFREGVRAYLNAHLFGNATTQDLWTSVQASAGQPVLEIADAFTRQQGFPVLSTSGADCSRRNASGVVQIAQRRFALDDESRTAELWSVPVVARRLGAEPVRSVLPATATSSIDLGACGAYLVNAGQSGLFRVHYDAANLARLTADFADLDTADQLGLLLDYWAFGRSGDAPFTDYLNLVSAIPADADPVIVSDTASSVVALARYANGRPSEDAVKAYGRSVLRPYFDRLGWDQRAGDTSNQIQARADLIEALGALGDDAVIAEVRRRVEGAEANPALLSAGIRDSAVSVYAANATTAEYETLLAHARATTDFVEQRRAWSQVGSADDPALAQRTLALILTDEMPRQLRVQVLLVVAAHQPQLAWDFLVAHRAEVEAMLDPLSRLEYPPSIARRSSDPAMAAALEQYASNFPAGAMGPVAGAASDIRQRGRMIERSMPAVEVWIAQRNAPPRRRAN